MLLIILCRDDDSVHLMQCFNALSLPVASLSGKPKGVVHSTAGYLLSAAMSTKWSFDLQEKDVYCCVADCGWITGHT